MQKQAITMCSSVLVAAAFCGFARWIQNQAAFELETGLMKPNHFSSTFTLVLCLLAIGGIVLLVRYLWYRGYYPPKTYVEIISGPEKWVRMVTRGIAGVMVIGAVIAFLIAGYELYSSIVRTLCLLAVAAAWSFVKLSEQPYTEKKSTLLQTVWCALPVVMYVYWIIVSYRTHAAVPAVWSYAVEVFAISASILGTFYFAGYGFEYPRPYAALGCLMTGAFLSLVTLLDSRNIGLALMMAAGAAMQLYFAWMIITSMREEWPEEQEAEEKAES